MSEGAIPLKKAVPIIAVTWILSLVTTLTVVYFVLNIFSPTPTEKMLEDLTKAVSGQVFQKVSETWCESQTLVAFKDELILCIGGGSGSLPGVWITKDGTTWKRQFSKTPSDWWASQLFNDKLYLGGGYGQDFAQITEYDGEDFIEVFKQSGGLGGGQGCVEALGVFNNNLFAGRKNEIWRSPDGRDWTKVFTFTTNKGIYQFAEDAGGFLAFEGEPISAPSKVYRTTDGVNWAEWASINDVEWFRSHSPSDRIRLGSFCFIADGKGYVFIRENDIWNSQFLRTFAPEGANAVAMKCKRIGNYMGISSGAGTGHKTKGQFWMWDGNCLRLFAELPLSILDFDLFQSNVYLACSSIVKDTWSDEYGANQISVILLPENIVQYAEVQPMHVPLFENRVIDTAGYGVGWLPILGYKNVTISIFSTQSGTLKFQSWDEVTYQWKDVEQLPIPASQQIHETINWTTKFLRLFFTPSIQANVTLSVNLS